MGDEDAGMMLASMLGLGVDVSVTHASSGAFGSWTCRIDGAKDGRPLGVIATHPDQGEAIKAAVVAWRGMRR